MKLFPLKKTTDPRSVYGSMEWSKAERLFFLWTSVHGHRCTMDELAATGGFTEHEFDMLSKGINPVTMLPLPQTDKDPDPVPDTFQTRGLRVEGVCLIADGTFDLDGYSFDHKGVTWPKHVPVTRQFRQTSLDLLGVGFLRWHGKVVIVEFDFPSKKLPDFSLYCGIDGRILKERKISDTQAIVRRCEIRGIGITLNRTHDRQTPLEIKGRSHENRVGPGVPGYQGGAELPERPNA